MRYERYKGGRFWAVYENPEKLICICVYKRGAIEIIKRLYQLQGLDDRKVAEALFNIEAAYKTMR